MFSSARYAALLSAAFLLTASSASADVITTVGTQVANDGDILIFPGSGAGSWNGAVGTSNLADPSLDVFNGISGTDPSSNYSGNWEFSYTAPVDPILGGSLSFGIIDHDSAAPGDQVASFVVDGVDLTSDLNALFNASGGTTPGPFQSEYNIYTVALSDATLLSNLQDGNAAVSLALQNGFTFGPTAFNGAAVDFSTLTVSSTAAVPEPNSIALMLLGAGVIIRRRMHSIVA